MKLRCLQYFGHLTEMLQAFLICAISFRNLILEINCTMNFHSKSHKVESMDISSFTDIRYV